MKDIENMGFEYSDRGRRCSGVGDIVVAAAAGGEWVV